MLRTALRPLQVTTHSHFKRNVSMATFSDPSFDFKGYLENRPRYPDSLYDTILSYHKGKRDTVLDLGCGPGLSLFPFAYHFKHLVGTDPSQGMLAEAQGAWEGWKKLQDGTKPLVANQADFKMLGAENLNGIQDESVDLITAATVSIPSNSRQLLSSLVCHLLLSRQPTGSTTLQSGRSLPGCSSQMEQWLSG
jgi:SAM-dependent methyltransferase